jgi:hypothetical protein
MKIDTSKTYTGEEVAKLLTDAEQRIADSILPFGGFQARVTRADGRVEEKFVKNIVLYPALNRIANRSVLGTSSVFYIIGVGTQTATHSLGSVQAGWGEVSRKTSNVTGASAQSCEWIFMTQTWAGNTDAITGVALDTAFVSDYPNSHASNGIYLGAANGLGVTLAASDFLALTYRVRVGSHNLGHST